MRKVTINLMGGLGNQMFQFAAGYKVSKKLGIDITFDTNFLNDRTTGVTYRDYNLSIFDKIDCEIRSDPGQKAGKFVIDDSISSIIMNDDVLNQLVKKQDIYLDGFFQKHDFVDKDLKDIFVFDDYDSPECFEIEKSAKDSNSLMLNVRRADYVTNLNANLFHGVLDMNYFNLAIKKLPFVYERLYIFSDDEDWCKKNFDSFDNAVVVPRHLSGKKSKDHIHMMSKFKNMIIANSTYSWWAAWLSDVNNNAEHIIAPGPTLWFAGDPNKAIGLLPCNWKTIERREI